MKRIASLYILFCFTSLNLQATSTFTKRLNDLSVHQSAQVITTADGGYVIATDYKDTIAGKEVEAIWVMKYDPCDNLLWSKQYFTDVDRFEIQSFQEVSDGGMIMTGYCQRGSFYSIFFIKLNSSGDKVFSEEFSNNKNLLGYSTGQLVNGDYFIYGNVVDGIPEKFFNIIVRIDQKGKVLSNTGYFPIPIWGKAIPTTDGGILCNTGNTIYKTNDKNELEWAKHVEMKSNYLSTPVEVNGGYVYARYHHFLTNSEPAQIFKLDYDGNLLWQSEGFDAHDVTNVRVMWDGNILATGSMVSDTSGVLKSHVRHVLLNSSGTILKQYILLNDNQMDQWSYSTALASDGAIIQVGTDEVKGSFANQYLTFSKSKYKFSKNNMNSEIESCMLVHYNRSLLIDPISLTDRTVEPHPYSANMKPFSLEPTTKSFSEEVFCLEEEKLTLDLGPDTIMCIGSTHILAADVVYPVMNWNTGAHTREIEVSEPGTYILEVSNGCEWVSDTVEVKIHPLIHYDFEVFPLKTTPLLPVNFNSKIVGNSIVQWMYNGKTSSDTTFQYYFPENGIYPIILTITDEFGCAISDTTEVSIDYTSLFIPNSFTPNGDGHNDIFEPKGFGIDHYEMKIFNRWGELIFEGSDKGWDGVSRGDSFQNEVFIYQILFTDYKGNREERVGKVTLIN